jgi:hypothetical protein
MREQFIAQGCDEELTGITIDIPSPNIRNILHFSVM